MDALADWPLKGNLLGRDIAAGGRQCETCPALKILVAAPQNGYQAEWVFLFAFDDERATRSLSKRSHFSGNALT
jgi:hypothetical protein